MKKNLLWALAALLFTGVFTSCSDDPDDPYIYTLDYKRADLKYNEKQVWTDVFTNETLYINPFSFAHTGSPDYGGYFSGYVVTKSTDKGYYPDMLAHQFDVTAGGSASGVGNPYLVAFWNSSETDATELGQRSTIFYVKHRYGTNVENFIPRSVKICNTTYAYYAMTRGNDYCRKFTKGDYLKLTAHGVSAAGGEKTLDFYLARCEGEEEDWYVTSWTNWDLSPLGEVMAVYFTMESSDVGQFGINTPCYFGMDGLEVSSKTYMLDNDNHDDKD